MESILFNTDFSNDLLVKINPGIVDPALYTNYQTPRQTVISNQAWQYAILNAAGQIDTQIAGNYGVLANLFGADPNSRRVIIQLGSDQPYAYPFILGQDPAGLLNSLKRTGAQSIPTYSEITFYFVVATVLNTTSDIMNLPINTFVVFHYIP